MHPDPAAGRAALVEQADRMASRAARASSADAGPLWRSAANIREHLYRVEHRTVDALEAIEALNAIERLNHDCRAWLERALLEAELNHDLGRAYKDIYGRRVRERDPECRRIAQRALDVLAAYEPLPDVLAELERAESPAPSANAPPTATPDLVLPSASDDAAPARVTKVERYGAKDAGRVVVFVTHPTRFHVGQTGSGEGSRVYVDIENATFEGPANYPMSGLVEGVRLGQSARGARVVLDLAESAARRVFYLPEPFRLVIDISKEKARDVAKRTVRRVVLDPGHGGHDPGATGPGGLREKDVVLDIAHRAAPLIARELGISTLLTRDADHYVPLDERTLRANAFNADLFVSIHCNASEDGAARGVMTFVLDAGREELATSVAARENAASSEAAVELANAFSRVTDPSMRAASLRFAELLQRAAVASLATHYRDVPNAGVKRAGFYVLAGARMPAALFETSFISNHTGELELGTEDFRQKMADAIVNAIRAYRDGL